MVLTSRNRSWPFMLVPLVAGLIFAGVQCAQPEAATHLGSTGAAGMTATGAAGTGAAGDSAAGTAGDSGAAGDTSPLTGTAGTGLTPDAGAAGTAAAGTNGAAGTAAAGTNGSAGTAAAGTNGSAGTAAAGTNGSAGTAAAGTNGSAGTAAAGTNGSAGTAAAGTSGAAGTVATPPVNGCDRVNWTFTPEFTCDYPANPSCNFATTARLPQNAIDGDPSTRYTDGQTQAGGEYVVLSFGGSVKIAGMTMVGDPLSDSAKAYKAEYSTDGVNFVAFAPAVAGTGGIVTIVMTFPAPTVMKAVRITQTGMTVAPATSWWSIAELSPNNCVQQ